MGPKPERNPDKSYPKPRPDKPSLDPSPNSHILGPEADNPDPSPVLRPDQTVTVPDSKSPELCTVDSGT